MLSIRILLLVGVPLTLGAAWYFAAPKSSRQSATKEASLKSSVPSSTSAPASTASTATGTLANAANQSPAAEGVQAPSFSDIPFIPREQIAKINFSDKQGGSDTDTSYVFYRVGRFVSGPNQSADLLLASISKIEWPCKGDCGEAVSVRYIEKDRVIYP